MRSSLRRQFSYLSVGNAAVAAASFATIVVLAHTLDPEELGRVVFAQVAAALAFAVLDPRLEDALVRYVPRLSARPGEPTALFRRFAVLDVAIGSASTVVLVAILLLGSPPLGESGDETFLALAIAQGGARAAQGTAAGAYAVTGALERWSAMQVSAALATSAAGLAGLAVAGAEGYLAASAAVAVPATVLMVAAASARMRERFGPATGPPSSVAGLPRFTAKSSLASSLAIGIEQLPLTILGAAAGPAVLATFRIALSPARLVTTIYGPISTVLFPVLSRAAAEDALERAGRQTRHWTRRLLALTVLAIVPAWLALPLLIELVFGAQFASAADTATLLVLAALLRGSVAWSKVLPLAIGRPDLRIAVLAAEGALLAASTWILADHGTTAVAAAHLAVAAASTLIWMRILWHADRLAAHDDRPIGTMERGAAVEDDRGGG